MSSFGRDKNDLFEYNTVSIIIDEWNYGYV